MGQIWPVGCILPTSGPLGNIGYFDFKTKLINACLLYISKMAEKELAKAFNFYFWGFSESDTLLTLE